MSHAGFEKWIPAALYPLELAYRCVVAIRNKLYDMSVLPRRALPGITISVGNIVLGGTGKTPMTIRIAEYLVKAGRRPAIVTRGFGAGLARDDWAVLVRGEVACAARYIEHLPDEARMQSVALADVPIVIGSDRITAVEQFLKCMPKQVPSHWILDDGFQHRKISRQVDIVLLDAKFPFANGHLLPGGRLREPIGSLHRANHVVFTRADRDFPLQANINLVKRFSRESRSARFRVGEPVAAPHCQDLSFDPQLQEVAVVCGIAQPDWFIQQLQLQNIGVQKTYQVQDHQRFSFEELQRISEGADAIVTTQKDYWRDPSLFGELQTPIFLAPLFIDLDDEDIAHILTYNI